MDKIDNFEKLDAALDEVDYDFEAVLNEETTQNLKAVVASWGEIELKNGHSVLEDYYSMKIPSSMLKEILSQNIELAYEVYTDGIRDTCQRELIVDATLRYMGLRSWPINGEGDKVMKEFVESLNEKAAKFSVAIGNIEKV
jgi:hypothetical protein